MYTRIKWMTMALSLIAANYACAASFDCVKAATKVEMMICTDPDISRLDEEMDTVFREWYGYADDTFELRRQQRKWLKERNKCTNIACLKQVYNMRISDFKRLNSGPKPCFSLLERDWPYVKSGHYPVCVDYLRNLNRFCNAPPPTCKRKLDPEIHSLSFPKWEELDPKKYLEVIKQVLTTNYYYTKEWRPLADTLKQRIINDETRLWHSWIDLENDGKKEHVVRFSDGKCEPINPSGVQGFYGFDYHLAVVNKDITQVDTRYGYLQGLPIDLLLHDKRMYILSRMSASNDTISLHEPYKVLNNSFGSKSVCEFYYRIYGD